MSTLMKPVDAGLAPSDDPAAVGPRLYGVIDVVSPNRIAGWAIDRTDDRAALLIDVTREGRPVATVRADRIRKDLERGNVGTGRYGFNCEITPPLEPGLEFTIAATARAADGATTELRRPGGGAAPDRRLLERIFDGVSRLRQDAQGDAQAQGLEALTAAALRLEVAQARIEAALSSLDAPAAPSHAGLWRLLAVTLTIAIGSLALGVWSMFYP